MTEQTTIAFDRWPIHAFRRFMRANRDVKQWFLVSDYNLTDKDRPCDIIAFSILPSRTNVIDAAAEVKVRFPADFKNLTKVPPGAKGFYWKKGAGFHVCWMLDKGWTLLHRPGQNRLQVARESIVRTLDLLNATNAPAPLVKKLKALRQLSLANNFSHKTYDRMLMLTTCYASLVGLIYRERPSTDMITWCSDRDALVDWAEEALGTFAPLSAIRWVTHFGKKLTYDNLPQLILAGPDWLDYAIRPPDYLAATLSSWNAKEQGSSQSSDKYKDMYRNVIADNNQIVALSVSVGEMLAIDYCRFQRFDQPLRGAY